MTAGFIINCPTDENIQAQQNCTEEAFLILVFLSAGIISMFTNNTALVAMFMPFITSVAKGSSGKIRRKHIYLPLAMGGLIGGTGSLAGSTAPLLANEVLEITGQKTFGFFTTAPVCLAILAVITCKLFQVQHDSKAHSAIWRNSVRLFGKM